MSAIAGVLERSGRHGDPARIGRMLAAMARRGADGVALHASPPLLLGHGLLRTARAALHVAPDGCAVSFDGRLDAREALAGRLGIAAPADDAALVLAAYRRRGPACAAELLGDFAYALWDAPARRLVCTRDRFGVRPLVYADGGGRFLLASEPKALIAGGVSPAVDDTQVADMLVGHAPPPERTLYRAIRRLPPAHSLIVEGGSARLERYWTLPLPEPRPDRDAPAAFRALLDEAVRCRLASPRPVAALLSGGLDSSSIACLAARHTDGAPLRTLSLVYDRTPAINERRFIEAVVATARMAPTFVDAHDIAPFDGFDALLAAQDGPFLAPNIANISVLHAAAAASGIGVLLDGHGGDEVVSFGAGRLTELGAARRWRMLWRELAALAGTDGMRPLPAFVGLYAAFGPARRVVARARRFARERAAPVPDARLAFVAADFARATGLAARLAAPPPIPPGADRMREAVQQYAMLAGPIQPLALELHDRAAAAAGIEVRFPFWDQRLIEFTLALPAEEKLAAGWTRRILRRALADVLPPLVRDRRDKLDFSPHLLRGLVEHGGDAIDRILLSDASPLRGMADLGALRAAQARLVAAHAAGAGTRAGGADGADIQAVWRAVMVGLWREQAAAAAAAPREVAA